MTNPFNEIANLLRQEEERKRIEKEKLEEERRKEQEERQRIEDENEKFISLHEPMICRVLNQLGETLWSSSWQPRDIKSLQIDPGPGFAYDYIATTSIFMQNIDGKITRCLYLYDESDNSGDMYVVGFQEIANKLTGFLIIAHGTFDTYVGNGFNSYKADINAKKLVSANENDLVEAFTEIFKSQYNL